MPTRGMIPDTKELTKEFHDEEKPIEKQWVVYGLVTKFIGRVLKETGYSAEIQYCEGQLFAPRFWKSNAIQRFATSDKAIDYVLSKSGEYSKRELSERVLDDFPETVRKEYLQTFHDLLIFHKNNLLARRSPKFTGDYIDEHCCPN